MRYTLEFGAEAVPVDVQPLGGGRYQVQVGDGPARTLDAAIDGALVHLLHDGRSHAVIAGARGDGLHTYAAGLDARLTVLDARAARRRASAAGGQTGGGDAIVRSPMPGRVVKVLVDEGQAVKVGQGVVIVEAMKMENELRAEVAGVVTRVHVKADDRVEGNAELVTVHPEVEAAR